MTTVPVPRDVPVLKVAGLSSRDIDVSQLFPGSRIAPQFQRAVQADYEVAGQHYYQETDYIVTTKNPWRVFRHGTAFYGAIPLTKTAKSQTARYRSTLPEQVTFRDYTDPVILVLRNRSDSGLDLTGVGKEYDQHQLGFRHPIVISEPAAPAASASRQLRTPKCTFL